MFRNESPQTKKYVQIDNIVKNRQQYKTKNKVFYSNPNDLNDTFGCIQHAIKINFHDKEKSIQEISSGVADSADFEGFFNIFLKTDMNLLLTNISIYENKWKRSDDSGGAIMKVYNSFTYTEDIKYEARLLELPMPDDFKLIIIAPNELDVLCNLYNKLTHNGLTAAIGSIQPLFTSISDLKAPSIKFSSTSDKLQHYSGNKNCLVSAEFGNVQIDENGVSIKVFTYMFPSNTQPRECPSVDYESLKKTFFFGLIFEDAPIFTGQYIDVK